MSALLLSIGLLGLQSLAASPPDTPEPAPVEVSAWPGDLSQGLALLDERLQAGEPEALLQLADQLALAARTLEPDEARAARVLYDTGLARAQVGSLEGALADLHSAAGLAGPGRVRELALYAAGTALLERAELLRQEVPEVAEALGLPAPPQTEDEGGPDALAVARQSYMRARTSLCERLAVDWRDEDTRANLELVTRRLRELQEIEQQREQQEQQQEQQNPNPEDEPEQSDPQDSQDQQSEPNSDPQDQEQQEPQQDPQDQEQPEPEDESQPEQDPDEQSGQDENQPESEPEPEPGEEQPQPQPEQLEERVLSSEEVQRLLDQLAEIEEQAQAVRARLLQRKRKPVEKDW